MTTTERRAVPLGFRARVLGASAGLLAVAILGGLFVQRAAVLARHERDIDASLEQERDELENLARGRNPADGMLFGGNAAAIFDTFLRRNVPATGEAYFTFVGGQAFRSTPAPVRLDSDPAIAQRWASLRVGERGSLDSSAGRVEYLALPLLSQGEVAGVFVVTNFVEAERSQVEADVRVAAGVQAVVLLLATAAAWIIAGRLLRPVKQVTESARNITETDLSLRIPVEGNDEIAELATTFNEMLDRLSAAFSTQRQFIDDAGHELRTPITIVRGHLELMATDTDEQADTIALVTDELDRMTRIVEDLLLLAKAERPDFVHPEPTELSDLTTELLAKARALGDRSWRLDACAEGTVELDGQRITQAVLNLARNAVEHTGPGDQISLGSRLGPDDVRIWVQDSGAGVSPADRERIFERFARGGDRRRSDGAGLGLAISEAIARGHGGSIELDSTLGRGALFTIVVPLDRHGAAVADELPTTVLPDPELPTTELPGVGPVDPDLPTTEVPTDRDGDPNRWHAS